MHCTLRQIPVVVAHFLFTYVHTSPAHLYIPQLFTYCLLTIICVTLMSIVYLTQHLFFVTFVFTSFYAFWACHSY